jgi:hypothetical protein
MRIAWRWFLALEELQCLDAAFAVGPLQDELSIQVVEFVLEDTCDEPLGLDPPRLTLQIAVF